METDMYWWVHGMCMFLMLIFGVNEKRNIEKIIKEV